jgi:hypothetical protein
MEALQADENERREQVHSSLVGLMLSSNNESVCTLPRKTLGLH